MLLILDIVNNYYYLLEDLLYLIALVFFILENTYGKNNDLWIFFSSLYLLIYIGFYKLIFLIIFWKIYINSIYISYIIYDVNNEKEDYEKLEIFIRIFIYIASLIHNKIFIITKWGLGENTKLFMDEKVKEEILLSNTDTDNNVLKRYNSMIDSE